MNNKAKMAAIGVLVFLAGFSLNNIAFSGMSEYYKVATVDIRKVAESSPQISTLQSEQKKKYEALGDFLKKAKADIDNETNEVKKKALEQKYNDELNLKKQAIDSEYTKKQAEIEQSIKSTIAEQAKKNKYNVVLAKGVVLYGGTDITSDIVKAIK